jgi:hypothetical protein
MSARDDLQDQGIATSLNLNMLNTTINMSQQEELALYKKHIRALWHHVERLEKFIQVMPDGIKIKAEMSELLLLKNGGVILSGNRIYLSVPGNGQLITSGGTM